MHRSSLRDPSGPATRVDLGTLQMDADVPIAHEAAYDAALERILVRACLLELSEEDRVLVELRLFHGWSSADIAKYVGDTELGVALRLGALFDRIRDRHCVVDRAAQVVARLVATAVVA